MKYLIWIDTTYACGAVICRSDGIVIGACPIYYRRMINRHFRQIESELLAKRLLISWKLANKFS